MTISTCFARNRFDVDRTSWMHGPLPQAHCFSHSVAGSRDEFVASPFSKGDILQASHWLVIRHTAFKL